MPSSLIEQKNRMSTRLDSSADFGQMGIHRCGVAPRQDETDGFAPLRADCAEDIGRSGTLIAWSDWTCAAQGPASGNLVFRTYARVRRANDPLDHWLFRLTLETKVLCLRPSRCARGLPPARQRIFLNSSTAYSFRAW